MPPKELLSVLAISIGLLSTIPYLRGIIRREVKPHMFSWIIWSTVCAITASVQYAEGGGVGSWYFMANSAWCLGLAIASYWIGTKDITRSDAIVLLVALSAIPVWALTNNPLWALFILIGIDGIAYVPTIRKSWNNPYEESAITWGMSGVVFGLSIAALENYTLSTWLYPAIFSVINTVLAAFLLMRRQVVVKP